MNKSLKESREKIREFQLQQIEDFRNRGWNDVADNLEKNLDKVDLEDGNFEKR